MERKKFAEFKDYEASIDTDQERAAALWEQDDQVSAYHKETMKLVSHFADLDEDSVTAMSAQERSRHMATMLDEQAKAKAVSTDSEGGDDVMDITDDMLIADESETAANGDEEVQDLSEDAALLDAGDAPAEKVLPPDTSDDEINDALAALEEAA